MVKWYRLVGGAREIRTLGTLMLAEVAEFFGFPGSAKNVMRGEERTFYRITQHLEPSKQGQSINHSNPAECYTLDVNKERQIMALKELCWPNTGIYQRTDRSSELQCSYERLSDLVSPRFHASNPQTDPLPSVDQIEEHTTEFLEQYLEQIGELNDVDRRDAASAGIDFVANQYITRHRKELEEKFGRPLSLEERRKLTKELITLERANDACDALFHLQMMRTQLASGEPEQAGLHTLWLGIAFERFRLRLSEPKAWTGDAIHRAASKGGLTTKKGVREQYEQLASDFRGSGLSQRSFARARRVSRSTLKRALGCAKSAGAAQPLVRLASRFADRQAQDPSRLTAQSFRLFWRRKSEAGRRPILVEP
jgi:hypothetical protein